MKKDSGNGDKYCDSLFDYSRRESSEVRIGSVRIGSGNPIAVQTMTDTDTNNTEDCIEEIARIHQAGGRIVRLTAQGEREGRNLEHIARATKERFPGTALVADIHFLPKVAYIAADHVDKVRINPGNYNDKGGDFKALLDKCRANGVALRIGVNHGSLSDRIVNEYGDTPRGMVASAMEFLRECRNENFDQVVISMKSSNTRVMVHAYRMLIAEMRREEMTHPIHLGVTEAGNEAEGRIKSAVGIGALLADGIGDTIRVSLTEPPENEIPVAQTLVDYFARRNDSSAVGNDRTIVYGTSQSEAKTTLFNPFEYSRRQTLPYGRIGGDNVPVIFNELTESEKEADGKAIASLTASGSNPVGEWRAAIRLMNDNNDRRPIILHRCYDDTNAEQLMIKAGADFGVMFIDGLADGIHIEADNIPQSVIDDISLTILQASRARMSKTEYIACPGCGRTLYDLQKTLRDIKARTSHLKGLKIGVMGCIVNGPGEMADADYGYVGAAAGHITLYRASQAVRRNLPQEQALDALIDLIKSDGKWIEPND